MQKESEARFTHQGVEFEWDESRMGWSAPLEQMGPYARLYLTTRNPLEVPPQLPCDMAISYAGSALRLATEAAQYLTSEAALYIHQAYDVVARENMFAAAGIEVPWDSPKSYTSVLMRGVFDIDTMWAVRLRGLSILTWRVDHSESRMPRRKTSLI